MDGDERLVLAQKTLWEKHYEYLLGMHDVDGFMIPTLDLWGSEKHIRTNHPIGQKFRLHKESIVKRGVLPQAENGDGTFITAYSDSTEPLNQYNNLGRFASLVNQQSLMPFFSRSLVNTPYVLHRGTLNFERRAKIGREFWREHWERRSGKKENVVTSDAVLAAEATIEHGLPLE